MLDAWFKPQKAIEIQRVERGAQAQRDVDRRTASMALYHYDTCMFCAKVRRAMDALALNIELRDILGEAAHRRALVEGGGRGTVPCLRIERPDGETEWMYESADIIRFLDGAFGQTSGNARS